MFRFVINKKSAGVKLKERRKYEAVMLGKGIKSSFAYF